MSSTTLGKRKDREEDVDSQKTHGSTLFVSNLPYAATSVDLQTLFSDIAPVRSAFVVTEHGTGVSKGVGYVSFAIKEDAHAAFEKISKEGLKIVGRNLRVQWAENKPKNKKHSKDHGEDAADGDGDDKKESNPETEAKKRQPAHPKPSKAPSDPTAIRTVVVSGLPPSLDAKVLWKKMRKYQGAGRVDWPIKGDTGEDDPTVAHVLFSTPSTANDAVTKLHAHVYKGHLLSVTLKKRLDSLAKPSTKPLPSTSSPFTINESSTTTTDKDTKSSKRAAIAAPSHASRLIVRNLPFDVTEQDLRAVFLPFGPIYSIHIPTVTMEEKHKSHTEGENANANVGKTRAKGFAFIWFLSKKDAEKAIGGCNGITVRSGTAETILKDKQKKKKLRRIEERIRKAREREENGTEAGERSDDDDRAENNDSDGKEENDDAKMQDRTGNERVIAVDWALSKDRWEEEKAKIAETVADEEGDEDITMEDERHSDDSEEGEDDGSDSEDDDKQELGLHDDESDGSSHEEDEDFGDHSDDSNREDEKPVKPHLPQTDVGTTVFIRNVPFEATEEDLRVLFRAFGPLRYARIAIDHATGRSRGTGFACFWNKEDADKIIQQSELLRTVTHGDPGKEKEKEDHKAKKKNPFTMPSLLTPDPSTSLAQNLVLHGRTLDVVRAVTRDEAGRLKEEGERAREKADKRNMYLLKEGVIFPNSYEASGLIPADLERRNNSYNARKNLLKTNPLLYISKTRLSIRQIPLFVTERMLKRLAVYATREFEKEVKEGKREGLKDEEKRVSREDEKKATEELGPAEKAAVDAHNDENRANDIDEEQLGSGEDDEGDASSVRPSKKSKKKKKLLLSKLYKRGSVKQAKLVRQQDRVDSISGKGRSKGYGFIEMYRHEDALRVLRWSNNTKTVGELFDKWWIEEVEWMAKTEKGKLKEKEKALERVKTLDERAYGQRKAGVDEAEKEVKLAEERVKRLQKELEESQQGAAGKKVKGNLIVEFSIENIQVVQRRSALQKEKRTGGRKRADDQQHKAPPRSATPLKSNHTSSPGVSPVKRESQENQQLPTKKRRLLTSSVDRKLPPKLAHSRDSKGKGTTKATSHQNPSKPNRDAGKDSQPQSQPQESDNNNPIGSVIGRKRMQRKAKRMGK